MSTDLSTFESDVDIALLLFARRTGVYEVPNSAEITQDNFATYNDILDRLKDSRINDNNMKDKFINDFQADAGNYLLLQQCASCGYRNYGKNVYEIKLISELSKLKLDQSNLDIYKSLNDLQCAWNVYKSNDGECYHLHTGYETRLKKLNYDHQ
jgi:hypothetical protein